MPRSLLSAFLNGVADVVDVFSIERVEVKGLPDCRATLTSFLAITVAVSFSKTMYPPLIALSMIPLLARALNVEVKRALKAAAAVAVLVVAAALPMALCQAYLSCGLRGDIVAELASAVVDGVLPLLLRCVAAATLTAFTVQSLGLTQLIEGLRAMGIPSKLLFALIVYVRYIPITLRQASKLLSAREARLLSETNRLRNSWLMLSTAVGALFMIGFHRAYRL
ncbi:MAG: energy-coupling factor transporter transmembrane component T, partial [Desulfurococcaceae archaeon]